MRAPFESLTVEFKPAGILTSTFFKRASLTLRTVMGLNSLRKKLSILITLSRLRRVRNLTKRKQRRRFWIRDIYKKREQFGTFNTLFEELKKDREYFFRYLRMTPDRFGHLLSLVRPRIEKKIQILDSPFQLKQDWR